MPNDQESEVQQGQQGGDGVQQVVEPVVQPPASQGGGHELPEWALKERKDLREEAAQWRVKLREKEDHFKDGLTKAEADVLRSEFDSFKQNINREKAAAEAGLTSELASRIKGETLEEMTADALVLAGGRRTPKAAGGGLTPGSGDSGQAETARDRARRTYKTGTPFIT